MTPGAEWLLTLRFYWRGNYNRAFMGRPSIRHVGPHGVGLERALKKKRGHIPVNTCVFRSNCETMISCESSVWTDCLQQPRLFELQRCLEVVLMRQTQERREKARKRFRQLVCFSHIVSWLEVFQLLWVLFLLWELFPLRSKQRPSQTANSPISGWEGEGATEPDHHAITSSRPASCRPRR